MARLQNFKINDEFNVDIGFNYSFDGMSLVEDSRRLAQYIDNVTGFRIVLSGQNFRYDEDGLATGKVKEVLFTSGDGDAFAIITDFKLGAAKANDAILSDNTAFSFLNVILAHNDQIIGTKGVNVLVGHAGDDVIRGKGGFDDIVGNSGDDILFGGGGNDRFFYRQNNGDDHIKDFDIGLEGSFDTLRIQDIGFEVVKAGKSTRVDFSDGTSVLLEGIRFADRDQIHIDFVE